MTWTRNIAGAIAACLLAPTPSSAIGRVASDPAIGRPDVPSRPPSPDPVRDVAPALAELTSRRLDGEVWRRPGLSPRDRSLVTIAALVAQGQTRSLGAQVERALENGVRPSELSEELLQLAFYVGWGRAMAAVGPVRSVFAARDVSARELPPAEGPLLPLDPDEDERRAAGVRDGFASVSPGTVEYTNDLLFHRIWQRPWLSQRDRSLVTIAVLVADGKAEQLGYHLGRGMDRGLTREQVGEMLAQLAFYAGWPSTFPALPVVKRVLAERSAAAARAGK